MATQEHTQEDTEARLMLAQRANLEINKLAATASTLCDGDDYPVFHGIMSRIQTLSEIIFYAQRLHGESDEGRPDMQKLENIFEGRLV